ncbi:hypothetical protein QEN19_002082 [Hanseniaspora menglaensis]
MSRNVPDLSYPEKENINLENRLNSSRRSSFFSSVSPCKEKQPSLSPGKKLLEVSPLKRQPLGNKTFNNASVVYNAQNNLKLDGKPFFNKIGLDSTPDNGRKLLRRNITVTKTGSFANSYDKYSDGGKNTLTTSPLRKTNVNENGLIKYKSLVLEDFNITETRRQNNNEEDDVLNDELKSFWATKGHFKDTLNLHFPEDNQNERAASITNKKEPQYNLEKSDSFKKLLENKTKWSLDDEVEIVPENPTDKVEQSVENHTELEKEDKQKLNEFKAPFIGIYENKEKEMLKKEFTRLNRRSESFEKDNDSFDLQKINMSGLEEGRQSKGIAPKTPTCISSEETYFSLDEFDSALLKNGYNCENIDLDL